NSVQLTNYTAYFNITHNFYMQPGMDDTRFYDTSCNNDGNPLDYDVDTIYDSEYGEFFVLIPTISV
ncbi:unnamed protein product, partial [marine sediment metagenome]